MNLPDDGLIKSERYLKINTNLGGDTDFCTPVRFSSMVGRKLSEAVKI